MKIVIINSLGKEQFLKCYNSLKKTIDINKHNVHKFPEKKTRGYTLNAILKKFGTNENILIVADDIEFTQGWYEKLIRNESRNVGC